MREVEVHGEIQMVGEFAVFPPFLIGQEVSRAGLHLDADETAVAAQGQNIGAAAVRQADLVQRRPGEAEAQTRGGAADGQRAFGKARAASIRAGARRSPVPELCPCRSGHRRHACSR